MRKTTVLFSMGLGLFGLAAGLGIGLRATPRAEAQPQAAITPKTQVPPEARSLSQAFASTARALRPSVVRLDIEMEAAKVGGGRHLRRDDVPPEMERFFEHFFGGPGDGVVTFGHAAPCLGACPASSGPERLVEHPQRDASRR